MITHNYNNDEALVQICKEHTVLLLLRSLVQGSSDKLLE